MAGNYEICGWARSGHVDSLFLSPGTRAVLRAARNGKLVSGDPGPRVRNGRSAAHIPYDSASDRDNTAVFPGYPADFFR